MVLTGNKCLTMIIRTSELYLIVLIQGSILDCTFSHEVAGRG